MNLASSLIKQILTLQDFETWSALRLNYLPSEYHTLFRVIDKHCETYHNLPTFEDLKFEIRDPNTNEQICAIESVECDVDPFQLLQYLKNEYAQEEILGEIEDYIDNSVAFEDADESVAHLYQIAQNVEDKVDLEMPQESMSKITLFESDDKLGKYLSLGLNSEYDYEINFSPIDLILVGGARGSGKSITCHNVANSVYGAGKTAIYFTIEMESRAILQRACASATQIPFSRLRSKNLNGVEWERVATWWAARFVEGQKQLKEYKRHRDFNRFHTDLTSKCGLLPTQQLDVIYDPSLTLSKIRAELDKRVKSELDVGIIIVDYINQVKRSAIPSRGGQYDWTEQIEVSKALKAMAQDYEIPVLSPYQTDATGEARFAKGILDAADAAFSLETYDQDDNCITFKCQKMRNATMRDFTSVIDWETLKIGPETALTPKDKEGQAQGTGEEFEDPI